MFQPRCGADTRVSTPCCDLAGRPDAPAVVAVPVPTGPGLPRGRLGDSRFPAVRGGARPPAGRGRGRAGAGVGPSGRDHGPVKAAARGAHHSGDSVW